MFHVSRSQIVIWSLQWTLNHTIKLYLTTQINAIHRYCFNKCDFNHWMLGLLQRNACQLLNCVVQPRYICAYKLLLISKCINIHWAAISFVDIISRCYCETRFHGKEHVLRSKMSLWGLNCCWNHARRIRVSIFNSSNAIESFASEFECRMI